MEKTRDRFFYERSTETWQEMTLRAGSHRTICWNGVSIAVPLDWEAKVTEKFRLNFEYNYTAVLEVSWQEALPKDVAGFIAGSLRHYEQLSGAKLQQYTLPDVVEEALSSCSPQCYATRKNKTPRLLYLFEKESCHFITVLLLQTQNTSPPWDAIASIKPSFVDTNDLQSWAVQDFQVSIPSSYLLSNYSMAAGFTTLHFEKNKTLLHLCRLAPASLRLQKNSLDEIFISLLGLENTADICRQHIDKTLYYERSPDLGKQVLLRLKRKNPFLLASLRHDDDRDRLLGVFMEGIHPLNHQIHDLIYSSYEVIQT